MAAVRQHAPQQGKAEASAATDDGQAAQGTLVVAVILRQVT